jgi:TPP-dependent pyruvate/acetoin dehydrogenase alpha subunit
MATTAPPDQATKEQLLDWYRTMRTIREFEERLHKEFATGEIPGFVHLYAGEEAIATGVCAHLRPDDDIASTHRGHGHAIAKGCDVHGMMAEIYGKRDGLCHGKGGSMHIADVDKGMLGANGIVGGGPPMNCGVGLSAKVRGTDQVGVSFTGDGGSNQGTFLESLNLAAVWHLPCVFVVENNGYAESTSDRSTPPGSTSPSGPTASACPGWWSTATTSSPSTRRPGRRSSGPGPAAARRCWNARSTGTTATSRATSRPTAPPARSAPTTCAGSTPRSRR